MFTGCHPFGGKQDLQKCTSYSSQDMHCGHSVSVVASSKVWLMLLLAVVTYSTLRRMKLNDYIQNK